MRINRETINSCYKKAIDNYYNNYNNSNLENALMDAVQIGLQTAINGEVVEENKLITRID